MIRLLVVDDHPGTRVETIEKLKPGNLINVVAEAATSDEALRMSEKLLPDIVLLDLHLPGLLGSIDLIKRMTALRNVKVIAFASQIVGADVQNILEAGAYGYVLKSDPAALLRMAILMVSRGSRNVTSPSLPRQLTRLTAEERTVLREITKRGKISKAAERLDKPEQQLNAILAELCVKLELSGPDKLVKWAKKQGF